MRLLYSSVARQSLRGKSCCSIIVYVGRFYQTELHNVQYSDLDLLAVVKKYDASVSYV